MVIGNQEISREQMPSYEIGKDYPTRQYAFMQDTLNSALQAQLQLQNPQKGIQTNGVGSPQNNPSQWSNQ